jgi:hypothetical protein
MPISPNEDEKQASLLQRELAKALRLSVQAVAHEPLPQRMIILLLRLAFAQTVRATLGSKAKRASRSKVSGASGTPRKILIGERSSSRDLGLRRIGWIIPCLKPCMKAERISGWR